MMNQRVWELYEGFASLIVGSWGLIALKSGLRFGAAIASEIHDVALRARL